MVQLFLSLLLTEWKKGRPSSSQGGIWSSGFVEREEEEEKTRLRLRWDLFLRTKNYEQDDEVAQFEVDLFHFHISRNILPGNCRKGSFYYFTRSDKIE